MPTAWSNPITFTSTVVTVPQGNTHWRDNPLHLKENIGNVRLIQSKSADYTAAFTDGVLLLDGSHTLTLPAAASVGANWVLRLKMIGTGSWTIDANGSETIDGELTVEFSGQYSSMTLMSDGSNWHLLEGGGGNVKRFFRQTVSYDDIAGNEQTFTLAQTLDDYEKARVVRIYKETDNGFFALGNGGEGYNPYLTANDELTISGPAGGGGSSSLTVEIEEYKGVL